MVVQAYILIQTDVGKAAEVAAAITDIKGVILAEDVTGPYDVIVPRPATWTSSASWWWPRCRPSTASPVR